MSKKKRLLCIITALLVCQIIPDVGAVWGAPVGVVVACYVLAVFSVFFTDYTINKKQVRDVYDNTGTYRGRKAKQ